MALFGRGKQQGSGTGKEGEPPGPLLPPDQKTESPSESSYAELMKKMKANVREYGQFFAEAGTPGNQIFILKHGRKNNNTESLRNNRGDYSEFVGITKQGQNIVAMPDHYVSIDGEKNLSDSVFKGTSILEKTGYVLGVREISSDEDKAFVKEAFSKSMEESKKTSEETKKKAALEVEQKKQADAKELLDFFGQLTQPPTSEGLAAPPPSGPSSPTV